MARLTRNRSKLLLGCGSAALAMGLAAAPQSASAQAIQATHADVVGSITRTDTGTGTETITVNSEVTVVDWTPDEVSGTALDFLPTGNTVTFQNSVNITDFALLSRILPSTNNDIVVFDGTVISQLIDPATGGVLGTGGTLAFYSPTGIFVGPSGTFDVGNLILTTLDPDLASFDDFVQNGGQLQLTGAPGTTAPIIITAPLDAGIVASPENSYFAVVAAEIQMFGTSDVNGSTAFIAGEQVNLTVTNGLFDIQIPVGTSVTAPIVIDGDVGGPSSTGITDDNHLIYAVAAAQNDPVSLLFSGNLGFDPAGQAGIVNGEIILSANYEVNNRSVAGVEPSDGLFTRFNGKDELTTVAGSIFLEDFQSTSTILAAANEEVQVTAFNGPSSIDGNLLMFGRNFSELTASNGQTFSISGNALVSAADIGLIGSDLSPGDADAVAGLAFVDAFDGGNLTIGGDVRVNATAEAGEDLDLLATGSATGGQASIASNGGVLTILGDATASADAIPVQDSSNELNIGGTFTGGTAQLFVTQAGQISIGGFTNVTADAVGLFASTTNASTGSTALGGNAFVQVLDASGQIALDQSLFVSATAFAGGSNETNQGGLATGGTAQIFIDNDGVLSIANDLDMVADATGGFNVGGQGGDGNGGIARAVTSAAGGTVTVGGNFNAFASGSGGDGIGGGNGFGGLAGAIAELGSVNITGNGRADALGFGGSATEGFGGEGGVGTGGLSFFQATGDLNDTATLTIGGTASLESTGRGGEGGDGDGSVIAPGRGGDGIGGQFATLNQADPNFENGAFLLAGGDNGNLSVGGNSDLFNFGIGGDGGDGGSGQQGGDGGDGFGGTAQAGSSLLGNDGSVGAGTVNLGDVTIFGNGDGGNGGNGGGTGALQGNGGNGEGFGAFFSFRAGTIDADNIDLNADGTGGSGDIGGAGTGGLASAEGDFGSNVTLTGLRLVTRGRGGFGDNQSGDAIGGTSQLGGGLFDMQVGDLFIDVSASGSGVANGPASFPGRFSIEASAGQLLVENLTGTAVGDVLSGESGPSSLIADGGDILVSGTMFIDVLDNFVIRTGSGSIIGGPSILDPSAMIDITSQGTVLIFGDNDNLISFGGSSLSIASRDIVIDAGARVGAFTMDFTSLNTEAPAILGGGGTPQGGGTGVGYSFIAEELERLEVGAFRFVQPEVGEQSGNAPDLIVRDVLAAGSLDDGVSSIEVVVDGPNGIARVEGVAAVVDAAPTDSFSLFAPGRIEVVTPGGIGIVGVDGDPTGTLFLGSDQIWVADSDLIALLQADSAFAGRNDQLAVAASGSNDPLGYLRAGAVSIEVGSQLLVRNTGTTSAQGGILVGEGGLSIFGGQNTESGLDVFAYGARLDSDGSLVTGEDFYQEVNFNNDGSSTGLSFYTDASEFNDCLINTGECDAVVTPEPPTNEESPDPAVVSVNNPAVVEAAISTTQPVEATEQESNDDFGIDFPGLVEAEDVEEEGDVEDPVASGGDSSLYGQGNSGNVRVEGN